MASMCHCVYQWPACATVCTSGQRVSLTVSVASMCHWPVSVTVSVASVCHCVYQWPVCVTVCICGQHVSRTVSVASVCHCISGQCATVHQWPVSLISGQCVSLCVLVASVCHCVYQRPMCVTVSVASVCQHRYTLQTSHCEFWIYKCLRPISMKSMSKDIRDQSLVWGIHSTC